MHVLGIDAASDGTDICRAAALIREQSAVHSLSVIDRQCSEGQVLE
jgi:hypothetical protein